MRRSAGTALCLLLACPAWGAEAKKAAKALPRISAAQTADALSGFQVKKGFRVELVAAEPLVAAPAALAFDERGRLFVAEMRDYPDRRGQSPHLGRVRLLEDMDEEGAYQTSAIYADDLAWPSAVACYGGGVFVAATPQILYLRDSRGDGIADLVKVVFTGFGGRPYLPNPQALLNSLNWGPDNSFHCGTAGLGGLASVLSTAEMPSLPLGNNDIAFDPRTLAMGPDAGPAQTGSSFDSRGRKFLCSTNHPLRMAMWEPRYLARNPFFAAPPELVDAAAPATAVYRLFPGAEAPKSRQRAIAPAKTQSPPTGGLAAGWLTASGGCVVYRGSAFGTNYFDNVFVADPQAHIIHRFVLRDQGLESVAERAADERRDEFLVSRDDAFRPMDLVNGPDGALYVADMRSGPDHGRIYRIVPEGFKRPAVPRLDRVKTPDLALLLAQANAWHADTAARLLYERQDLSATGALSNLLSYSRFPLARLRALQALAGLGALWEPHLLRALKDDDERVRERAVRLAEPVAASGGLSAPLWQRLRALAADPSIRVRYQLALSLGACAVPGRGVVLADLLARDPDNPWMRAAALSSMGEGAGLFLAHLAGDSRFLDAPGQQFMADLATMIGLRGRMTEVTQVISLANQTPPSATPPYGLLVALGEGLHRTGSSLALADRAKRLQRFFDVALNTALTEGLPLPLRVQAVRLLGVNPQDYAPSTDWLRVLLSPVEPYALESAVLAALGRWNDPAVAPALLWAGRTLALPLRNEALMALMARTDRAQTLLAAIEHGQINPGAVPEALLNLLRTHRDPAISQRALRRLGPVPRARPALLQQFEPALTLGGVASHGHDLFLARCAACHRLGGEGRAFGPDLAATKTQGREAILDAILDPSRDLAPGYETCVAETKEGESLLGTKTSENATTVTFNLVNLGPTAWLLADLASVETRSWSLMPDGLEAGLSPQDMADLLDYLLLTPR